ncbi:MAG: hypothetical protein IT426_05195 [Pirellulales bacterium]|nr:hypothetical protein [Pirellulales bacterium]
MTGIRVASSLMILGLILVITSFVLPFFLPSLTERSWTEEQARQRSETGHKLHQLAGERGGHTHGESANHAENDKAALEREFAETEASFKRQDEELKSIQERSGNITFGIRCAGAGVLVIGLGIFFRAKRRET